MSEKPDFPKKELISSNYNKLSFKKRYDIQNTPIADDKFIFKLTRNINPSIYYNDRAFVLLGKSEVRNLYKILFLLYESRRKSDNGEWDFTKNMTQLQYETKLSPHSVRSSLWKLIPVLVNVRFYKKKGTYGTVRYFGITENGIKAINILIKRAKKSVSRTKE